jgi:hypothetical protein
MGRRIARSSGEQKRTRLLPRGRRSARISRLPEVDGVFIARLTDLVRRIKDIVRD